MNKRYLIGFLILVLAICLWWYNTVYLNEPVVHNGFEAVKETHDLFLYYATKMKGLDPKRYQPPEVISVDDMSWQVRYYIDRNAPGGTAFSENIYFNVDRYGSVEISQVVEDEFNVTGLVCDKKPTPTRIYYARDLDSGVYKDYTCPRKH